MRKYVDRREVQRRNLDETAHLTGYNALYGHARFVKALRSVCGFTPHWVGYEPLEWPKVAVDGLRKRVDGAVPVKWARNEESCLIGFGPILAKHPHLEVALGQIRKLPFAVEDGRLVLNLRNWKLDASEPQKRLWAARARWERMSREEKQKVIEKAKAKLKEQQRRYWEAVAAKLRKG